MSSEYSKEMQLDLHNLLRGGDVTAFSKICVVAIPYLETTLGSRFQNVERQLLHDIVIDTLIKYKENPSKYDSEGSALLSYLYMDAVGDMLNHLQKKNRQPALVPFSTSDVERVAAEDGEEDDGIYAEFGELDLDALLRLLHLTPLDEQLVRLIANGQRDTAEYAKVLQIRHLPLSEQRLIVKRQKDRLRQWLRTNGPKRLR